MAFSIRHTSLGFRLSIVALLSSAAFVAGGTAAWYTMKQTRLDGPVAEGVHLALKAQIDLESPRSFALEAFEHTMSMVLAESAAESKHDIEEIRTHSKDFFDSHAEWAASDLPDFLKASMAHVQDTGKALLDRVTTVVIPAVEKGNMALVARETEERIPKLYREHQAAVDVIIPQLRDYVKATTTDATALANHSTLRLMSGFGIAIFTLAGLVFFIARSITSPARSMLRQIQDMTSGSKDLSQRLPFT
jgi:hypothetical protein